MIITYPLMTVVDDSGTVVTGATVTIAGVTDKAGAAIASPGASVNQAGPNVGVDYDAEAKGEAWITLSISKPGSTFTGLNATPSFFLSRDPSRIENALPNVAPTSPGGLLTSGTGLYQINPTNGKVPATLTTADVTGGNLPANAVQWGGSPVGAMPNAITPPTVQQIDTQLATSHGAGAWGGSGGTGPDPLAAAVPGTYTAGSAGYALGNLATLVWGGPGRTLTSAGLDAVLDGVQIGGVSLRKALLAWAAVAAGTLTEATNPDGSTTTTINDIAGIGVRITATEAADGSTRTVTVH